MRRPIVVLLGAAALVLAVAAGAGGAPTTAVPPSGPRLAVEVWRGGSNTGPELLTIGLAGEDPQVLFRAGDLLGGPELDHPNWNAEGTELAFYGSGDETTAVFLLGTDGSAPRLLATSEHPGGLDNATLSEPLFDPKTGDLLVAVVHTPHGEGLFGDERPAGKAGQIRTEFWALPTDGSKGRRLSSLPFTRKRPLIPFPSSIADGGTVAATILRRRGFGVATIDPRTARVHVVVPSTTQPEGTLEPAISPDGTQIVYKVDKFKPTPHWGHEGLISSDLMIVSSAGGTPRRLARVKGGVEHPSWDPSSSRIAFTALNAGGEIDAPGAAAGSSLMEINPDGTCLTRVFSLGEKGVVEGAAWQPGADRGAGPLSC